MVQVLRGAITKTAERRSEDYSHTNSAALTHVIVLDMHTHPHHHLYKQTLITQVWPLIHELFHLVLPHCPPSFLLHKMFPQFLSFCSIILKSNSMQPDVAAGLQGQTNQRCCQSAPMCSNTPTTLSVPPEECGWNSHT